MASGFLTASQERDSSLVEWRMAEPEHDSTEWLTSWLSRWKMMRKWNSNFNLYTHMKKIVKTSLLSVIGISLLAATFEAETALLQFVWSSTCLVICAASAAILKNIEKKEDRA